eukprot:6212045-Pleurochrysis_carterae.AAC.2
MKWHAWFVFDLGRAACCSLLLLLVFGQACEHASARSSRVKDLLLHRPSNLTHPSATLFIRVEPGEVRRIKCEIQGDLPEILLGSPVALKARPTFSSWQRVALDAFKFTKHAPLLRLTLLDGAGADANVCAIDKRKLRETISQPNQLFVSVDRHLATPKAQLKVVSNSSGSRRDSKLEFLQLDLGLGDQRSAKDGGLKASEEAIRKQVQGCAQTAFPCVPSNIFLCVSSFLRSQALKFLLACSLASSLARSL